MCKSFDKRNCAIRSSEQRVVVLQNQPPQKSRNFLNNVRPIEILQSGCCSLNNDQHRLDNRKIHNCLLFENEWKKAWSPRINGKTNGAH